MSETTAPDNGVAVITGGASGIGYATAAQLHAAGWKLAILDVGDEALEAVRQDLGSKPGVRVTKIDVTDEPAVERELAAIENELGPITGVVNSAGIAADRHVFDTPIDLFRRILDINVVGTFIVARAAARHMQKRGRGAIVNLASIAALAHFGPDVVAYSAAKAGLIHFTRVTAVRYARDNVRCNIVVPGLMDTPLVEMRLANERAGGDVEALRRRRNSQPPMGRMGTAWDVAHAALFLASNEARYITGAELVVDGGLAATVRLAGDTN